MDRIDGRRTKLRTVLLIAAGLGVLAVMLFRVPLATVFSLGVLLICPLLMVGMHGGHHGGAHPATSDDVGAHSGDTADGR